MLKSKGHIFTFHAFRTVDKRLEVILHGNTKKLVQRNPLPASRASQSRSLCCY